MVCWVRFAGIRSRGSLLPAAKRGSVSDLEPACDCGLFPRRAEPHPQCFRPPRCVDQRYDGYIGEWRGGCLRGLSVSMAGKCVVWCGGVGWGGAGGRRGVCLVEFCLW